MRAEFGIQSQIGQSVVRISGLLDATAAAGCSHLCNILINRQVMIPNHLPDEIGPNDCVTILTRHGNFHFLVHSSDQAEMPIPDGYEILVRQMKDRNAIAEFIATHEQDIGGEG